MANDQEEVRLRQARALNRSALAAIYEEFHLQIYRYVYRRVGDVELSRDLTSSVFQRLLQSFHQGNGPQHHLRAWLYRTAHNAVIDFYRRQKHRNHLALNDQLLVSDRDPAQSTQRTLTAEAVRNSLCHLTPEQQQVIVLKFLEGLDNGEVATIMNKSVGAVKALQHRALVNLKHHLRPEEELVNP